MPKKRKYIDPSLIVKVAHKDFSRLNLKDQETINKIADKLEKRLRFEHNLRRDAGEHNSKSLRMSRQSIIPLLWSLGNLINEKDDSLNEYN